MDAPKPTELKVHQWGLLYSVLFFWTLLLFVGFALPDLDFRVLLWIWLAPAWLVILILAIRGTISLLLRAPAFSISVQGIKTGGYGLIEWHDIRELTAAYAYVRYSSYKGLLIIPRDLNALLQRRPFWLRPIAALLDRRGILLPISGANIPEDEIFDFIFSLEPTKSMRISRQSADVSQSQSTLFLVPMMLWVLAVLAFPQLTMGLVHLIVRHLHPKV